MAMRLRRRQPGPIVGRAGVMRDVRTAVSDMVAAFCGGDGEKSVCFITFEGGSGIGKTRCLREVREQVRLYCTPRDRHLRELYAANAVFEVSLTFNGRGTDFSHMPPPDVEIGGSKFLEVAILAEVMHAKPYFMLDAETQASVGSSSSFAEGMDRVAMRLKKDQDRPEMIALYVLLDEMQLLAAHLGFGGKGEQFIKEMCDAVGRFNRDSCRQESKGFILIPCLAGCRVPEFASRWPKQVHVLTGLSWDDSREVVRSSVGDPNASFTTHPHFNALLQDCLGVPRFLEWVGAGLRSTEEEADLDDAERIQTAKESMLRVMERWAAHAVEFGGTNLEQLRDALRYCLVQEAVDDAEVAVQETMRGYVYWKREGGRVVFQAPIFLLNYLGGLLRMHQPLVEVCPNLGQGEALERACLEMVYVRLSLARGSSVELSKLFPGCTSESQFMVQVPTVVTREDEAHEFVRNVPSPRHFEFARANDSSTKLVLSGHEAKTLPARVVLLPAYGKVVKTLSGCPVADGRVFLMAGDRAAATLEFNTTLEVWFRFKGTDQEVTVPQLKRCCDEAFAHELELPGRTRVYVIFAPYQSLDADLLEFFYVEQQQLGRNVLVMDAAGCEAFMPGFFSRCVKPEW